MTAGKGEDAGKARSADETVLDGERAHRKRLTDNISPMGRRGVTRGASP